MPESIQLKAQDVLRSLLERSGVMTAFSILAVAAAGWAYLLAGAGMNMPAMGEAGGMAMSGWTVERLTVVLVMWLVMMAAMMLPSAAPMILLHRTIARKRFSGLRAVLLTGVFAAGYLLVWAAFSIAATAGQWALDQLSLLSPPMALDSKPASAALLLIAGIYQLSPAKYACLSHCRSPLSFLAQHWSDRPAGVLAAGVRHGLYCVGCCWALMALLFVGGVMNLLWIAALTIWVLLEKVVPHGRLFGQAAGVVLIAAAVAVFVA